MTPSQIKFDFDIEPVKKEEAPSSKSQTILKWGAEPGKNNAEPKPRQKRGRKSLKETGSIPDIINVPEDEVLFQKQYYPIGDVALMFKENTSLIRFWEKEFDILKPKKNKKGDRFFRPEDIKNLKMIYHLIRERKYTVEGAKEFLKNNKSAGEKHELIESLEKIKLFLLELKNNL